MPDLLLAAIVSVAFATEAALGFGATVITVTLGSLVMGLEPLLAAFVPVNLLLSGYLLGRHRRHVDGPGLGRRILPFIGAGLVVGLLLFRLRHAHLLQLAFALFVILLSLVELYRLAGPGQEEAAPLSRPRAALLLLLGGVVHGLFASGGPMVVYVMGRGRTDKARFRATLAALWLILNGILVANYWTLHLFDGASARRSLLFLPSLLLGLVAGEWLHHRLPDRLFRRLVYVVLLVAATTLGARTAGRL